PGMLTWRNDNSRSGVNNQELALTPAIVKSGAFGKLFSCPIDGYAYAQPLYVSNLAIAGIGTHNVVFVATEKDSVYAFDADANPCKQLWKTTLFLPGDTQPIAFPNLTMVGGYIVPFVGITGTPVIGGNTQTLYVVAAVQTIPTVTGPNATYSQKLYALDLTVVPSEFQSAGAPVPSPIPQASAFNSSFENQRPALLLDNGTVYMAFGSYGGLCTVETAGVVGTASCPYHGWLLAYDSSSLQQTGILNITPSGAQGGIWQSGAGPSAASAHNLFVATGNGPPNLGTSYSD